MTTKTIVDNDSITLWYHPDKKIVHHRLHKFVYGETLRTALIAGVETLAQNGASKWLSDDRKHAAISQEDVEWGREVWTDMAIKAGWKYWAIMVPDRITGKLSYQRMVEDYKTLGINVEVFDELEQAMAWLESID